MADYVQDTGNHVLYRVTPIFEGADLLARGVRMEGWSVEDNGAGVCFDVFCYNVQPGIVIDYADGSSREETAGEAAETEAALVQEWLENVKKAMEDFQSSMAFLFAEKAKPGNFPRFLLSYYHKTEEISSLVLPRRRV